MGYIKASDVLPEELISEIQKYIDGQMLYVPRKGEEHSGWGEKSGIRENWKNGTDRFLTDMYREKPYRICLRSIICLKKAFRELYGK